MSEDERYIHEVLHQAPAGIEALESASPGRSDLRPNVGREVGRFLSFLVRATRARRILEIGTSVGYATLWLAHAAKEIDGFVTTIEIDGNLAAEAADNLGRFGVGDVTEVLVGDACEILEGCDGPFDLILQDAGKDVYPVLFEPCLQRLAPGGMLVADDALFPARGMAPRFSDPVDAYNWRAAHDNALFSAFLPVGDGLLLSWKRPTSR